MFTRLIADGVLKLVQICKYSNQTQRVAKLFDPRGTVPQAVLKEVEPNVFEDDVEHKRYKLTPTGMVGF